MWNCNSRRWLVKDEQKQQQQQQQQQWQKHPKQQQESHQTELIETRTRHHKRSSWQGESGETKKRVSRKSVALPCLRLNQIIEVLLALLLANCLVLVPATLAAFDLADRQANEPDLNIWLSQLNYRQSHSMSNSDVGGDLGVLQPQYDARGNQLPRTEAFKISPKPCSIGRIEGTCMFVWECIKSEGRHVGMCVDSFMFGSCCAHNYTDNIVLPQTFSYTRPTKPIGISSLNHRPRPPHHPYKPSISGMTTIERPHGAGTLVIRPSGPHHQHALSKPHKTTTTTTSTTTSTTSSSSSSATSASTSASASASSSSSPASSSTEDPHVLWTANSVLSDLHTAASVPSASASHFWSSSRPTSGTQSPPLQPVWHLPTEPSFVTKPRPPPSWQKPTQLWFKPSKPTKRPIAAPSTIVFSTRRPSPQPASTAPPSSSSPSSSSSSSSLATSTTGASTTTSASTTTKRTTLPTRTTTTQRTTTTTTTTTIAPPTTAAQASSSTTSRTTPQPQVSHTKPSRVPITSSSMSTSMRPYSRPTPVHWPGSESATPTTTHGYRPTSSTQSSLGTTSSWTAMRPSAGPVASSTTTTRRPASPTTTTTTPIRTTTSGTRTTSSAESNEIAAELSSGSTSIKTISAARSECGIPVLARPETRIVGGKSAAFGRWPWQVSVRRTSFFGFSSTHRCGGALINENWIATAGHCVDDLLISQIRIRVGEYDFSHVQEQLPYIERGVAKKVVHPKYNFFTYEYDLALVKLEQPLEFAPHVSPICLPQTDSLLIGMNATVTGWGRLSEGGTLPSVLQEVSVPIVSNDNCKTMFLRAGRQEFIPEIFLCAGYETGGQDSCQGDSGGPLQVKAQDGRFFLAGIISWGIGCAEANLPGVCTRISKFVPWILENVT